MRPRLPWWVLCLLYLLLSGCSSVANNTHQLAREYGFNTLELPGEGFTHTSFYRRPSGAGKRPRHLRVYIEGDGRPWLNSRVISPDPTPAHPLVLKLMSIDPGAALYLGRPCYHGRATESACHPWHWTHGRYSESVVNSMAAALQEFITTHAVERVTLIGHSGGGTLALLLIGRVPQVEQVIALAANVDPDGWADEKGYSRLKGSLSPVTRVPVQPVREIHLVGERDRVITPGAIAAYTARAENRCLIRLEGCGHMDCWAERWPLLLDPEFHRAECN